MRTRILIITDNTADQINGVVTTFRNLRAVAEADGYEFAEITAADFSNISAPRYPEVKLSWPWRIGSKIQAAEPDHVHIATEGPVGLAARLWLDRKGWRYNTSYHTRFPEFIEQIYGISHRYTYAYLRWFHRHSGKILVTTDTMAQELRQHGFRGDLVTWTRGVDREVMRASDANHQRGFCDHTRVLYVGRVSREKNLDALCCLGDEFKIEIVGDGPYRPALEQRWPRVKFLGYQQGQALADSYSRADVFAFPSRSDTFGIVMIEAMSLGTPVAGYPVPGPIDVVEPGITGFVNDDLAVAIRKAAKLDRSMVEHHSRKWTWQRCWNTFRDNLVAII